MRKIKFRGQRVDNGEWAYGHIRIITVVQGKKYLMSDWFGNDLEVKPESVGQFTGLTDKNGNEIYEGDIITFDGITSFDKIIIGEVKYSEVRLRYEYGKNGVWYTLYAVTMPTPRIIGNIHDTPELLNN